MKIKSLATILFLINIVSFVIAESTFSINILDYGLARVDSSRKIDNKDVITGFETVAKGLRVVTTTESIPAVISTNFGIQFQVTGMEGKLILLKIKAVHPPITNPATQKTSESDEWTQVVKSDTAVSFAGWTFDNEWELVPGEWTFQIFYGKEKLAEKTFHVVNP